MTTETTSGNTFPTTPASSTDLLETVLLSVSPAASGNSFTGAAMRNGSTGSARENSAANPANIMPAGTYDFFFDLSHAPAGYDLTSTATYSGWSDFRAGQDYKVYYREVGTSSFSLLADVDVPHTDGTLRVGLTGTTGRLATQVDAVRVVNQTSSFVYREFDVHGSPNTTSTVRFDRQLTTGNTLPTTLASNTDLLQTALLSVSPGPSGNNFTGIFNRNGSTGTAHERSATNPGNSMVAGTYDFYLDLTDAPLGFDISEIVTYSGWSDFRAGQDHILYYSQIGSSDFILLKHLELEHTDGTQRIRLFDLTGTLATGVDAIRFVLPSNSYVYREIDVFGTPTLAPEPSTLSLLGLALLASLFACRRRRSGPRS